MDPSDGARLAAQDGRSVEGSQLRRQPRTTTWGIFDIGGDPRALDALDDLGVGWVRVQLQVGDPGWDNKLDTLRDLVRDLQDLGIGTWLTLYHRDPDNILDDGTVGYAAASRGGFPPADPDRYQDQVESIVRRLARRLDGDRTRASDWLVVQFGNEVNPRDVFPPDRRNRFWHGTSDEYLELLTLGREAVDRVDRRIPVAAAGISSGSMQNVIEGDAAAVDWNSRLLREADADWADVHLRHDIDDVGTKVAWVRRRWDGDLAATEVAGPDPRVTEYSDAVQADELTRRLKTAQRRGVDRGFWASLVENPTVAPIYRHEGLIERDPWIRKPAFDAYVDLIARQARR